MRDAAEIVRFLLELCVLAALAYWGWRIGGSTAGRIGLAVGAPLLIAVIWGVYGAPESPRSLRGVPRLLLEAAIFGGAAIALAAVGQIALAVVLAVLVVADQAVLMVTDRG